MHQPWKKRYDEACIIYRAWRFIITITEEVWKINCTGVFFNAPIRCETCEKNIENPPTIHSFTHKGFQCPWCVENERKKQQNGRPMNQGHKCDGSCGKENCDKTFTEKSNLKKHQEAQHKKHVCPVPECHKHTEGYGTKEEMTRHFRDKHKDLCDKTDDSCLEYDIPPKRTKRLSKPKKYDGKITNAEWRFLKRLVRVCIKHDIESIKRWNKEDQDYLKEINTNEYKHKITEQIADILLYRNMVKGPCLDHAGGYLPTGFVLDVHSLYQLTLDRKNNDRPHFLPNMDVLENLSLIILGMNTATSIVAAHRECTCDYVREKVKESRQKTKEDEDKLIESQSKSRAKINDKWETTTLYNSCNSIFNGKYQSGNNKGEYKDKKCREEFKTSDKFFDYSHSILEKKRGYCPISGIFLQNESSGPRSPFKLSLDATKPIDCHVSGNIRIICQFLNSANHDKNKTYVNEDDSETAWTPKLFKEYFQINEA